MNYIYNNLRERELAGEFEVVDVWLGCFSSADALSDYMEEAYVEGADDAPVSRFAADQREIFYDHDFVESGYFHQTCDLDGALFGYSFMETYIDELREAWSAKKVGPVNTVILVFGSQIAAPTSVSGEGYRLTHLGPFRCDPEA